MQMTFTCELRVAQAHRLATVLSTLLLATAAQAAGTLTVCTSGPPDGFDIVQYESLITQDAAGLTLYDQLLHFKPGSTEVVPGLAERWTASPNGQSYTFHLRKGVKFHTTPYFKPTRDFNADDVLFSMNRMADKKHPAHGIAKNGYIYWEGMEMSDLVKSVTKVDDHTVRIDLTRPETPFLANIAMSSIGSVSSAEYAARLQKEGKLEALNTQPIGTGPFVFKSYQKDAVVRFSAHTAYWGGAPKVDNLILAITPDPNVRVQKLKAGECLMTSIKPDLAGSVEQDAKLTLLRTSPLVTSYIAPNAKKKFLSDKRFREALWLALDKKSYIQAVYAGQAKPATSFLPPGIWSHDASLPDRSDVEKARALVKASGYDGTELAILTRIGGGIDGKRAAELMQADWGRVGIKIKVQMMEWGELLKRSGKGEHDITFLSWAGDNGDPDNFFTPNLSCAAATAGGNKSQWCNPAFDDTIEAARRTTDPAKRTELYRKAQRIVYDEAALIPTVYPVDMIAMSKRLSGFIPSPFSSQDYRSIKVD